MRVLVTTTANVGHFGPLVPFARACVSAGHEVLVAAPASFADNVAAAGLEHRPVADPPPELLGPVLGRLPSLSFEEANAVVVGDVFGRLDAQAALPGLVEIIADWRPDVVLRETAEFGALVAARAAGVAQAVAAIGLNATTEAIVPLVSEPLCELESLAELPQGAARAALHAAPTLTCAPASLDALASSSFAASGPLHRFRDDSRGSGPGALPESWGDASDPVVYVSFGSIAAGLGGFEGLYPAVLAAFADQPVRVLLTTGHAVAPTDLEPVPANARVEQWWPQGDVMAHAAVVVGHGGFGTTMTALAAGVPQVILPLFSLDQRVNAASVAVRGAGLTVDGGPSAVAELPAAVNLLLVDTSYRDAARAVAAEMAALPPAGEAVTVLERLARP
jgi:UDP:flavonoid glycosyltransferase YjiC (YdhE family)